jgi:acetyltransferase-like isoleucine patch superfamily enzyme
MISAVRPFAIVKDKLLSQPIGLGHLGSNTAIHWPRRLRGRNQIWIGERTLIRSHSIIEAIQQWENTKHTPRIHIGSNVYIGRHVYITSINGVTIENGCVLSEHVYITDLNHGYDPQAGPIMSQNLESKGPVAIGRNSFLGFRVSVMPGVSLGEHCVVGANSVVTHSFPAYSMIVGTPARLVKVYSLELKRWVPVCVGASRSEAVLEA